ncbi:hypothetical protein AC1031_004906 [Aphanomyces cochlioides]|nr:hypothetical protein AC1031_004906 [Aphanomyces cochlioides]
MNSSGDADSDNDSVVVEGIKKERKTRFAYKNSDDIKLLKEVLGDDGIFTEGAKESHLWHGVHERLQRSGMDVSEHSLRRRLKTIHEAYCSATLKSKKSSGVDETPVEKTQLLEAYDELYNDRKAQEGVQKT